MDETKQPSSLKEERSKTDISLTSERSKTDVSFSDHRKRTESTTNKKVVAGRQGADDTRDKTRKEADANTNLARSGRTELLNNRKTNEVTADNALKDQRSRVDAAVMAERVSLDAALVIERGFNDAESNKFLDIERRATDINLKHERSSTDSEAKISSNRLTDEVSLHNVTKEKLTSRDEFLAIVSHDLKNPIGAILSCADLILEDSQRDEVDIKNWTEIIKRNAETSLRLIRDILDMERFAEGKLSLQFDLHDINDLIVKSVETFSHVAAAKEISLTFSSKNINKLVRCDGDRIAQALSNLVSNALKFTPKGGTVTIDAFENENNLQVSVKDTGIGIPDDQKKRIFDRYAQIKNKDRQGLGLGLYISAMLIEAHQGDISVISAPWTGSTFTFIIPNLIETLQ